LAEISAAAVKALRAQTGAGMMDCKRVLQDAEGDLKRAVELLRERGLAKAGKREGRATSEGLIAVSVADGVGGMVELGCETDFVARTDDFGALADLLAAAVAADPGNDAPEKLLESEVGGRKVADRVTEAIAVLGENVVVKRTARIALDGPGVVGGYVHAGGKLGVLVGVATSAQGDAVAQLAKDLAMHVAAADPSPVAVDKGGVASELIDSERAIYRRQAEQEGKPEKVIDRIVEGKVAKFLAEVVLLEQAFVKDPDQTVGSLLGSAAQESGGEISVTGFHRFKLGEASEA
jgi:elongation factor Ts